MKIKTMAVASLCVLALAGCGKKGADKFNEVKLGNASAADSVAYMIGEQLALQREEMSKTDTLLKSAESQSKYDEGFYAGLEAMTGKDKAFNEGFAQGVMVASQLVKEGERMGENFSIDALASGYSASFDKNGKPVKGLEDKVMKNQSKLMSLMNNMQAKAVKKQTEDALKKTAPAKKKLDAQAKKEGYTKTNGYYVKTVDAGNGTQLKEGDVVTATVALLDSEGNMIFPSQSNRQTVGTASAYSPAIDAVQTSLSMGGHYMIMGTIDQLFNPEEAAQGIMSGMVDPETLYVFDYTVSPAAEISTAMPVGQ